MKREEVERRWREMHIAELDQREREYKAGEYAEEAVPVIEKVLAERSIELQKWRAEQDRSQQTEAKTGRAKQSGRLRLVQIILLPVVGILVLFAAVMLVAFVGSTLARLFVPRDLDLSPGVERVLEVGVIGAASGFVIAVVAYAVSYANSLIKRTLGKERED